MSSVQHADPGVPNSTFQGLSEYTHIPPPLAHSAGANEATKAPTPENAPRWHEIRCPREILSVTIHWCTQL